MEGKVILSTGKHEVEEVPCDSIGLYMQVAQHLIAALTTNPIDGVGTDAGEEGQYCTWVAEGTT